MSPCFHSASPWFCRIASACILLSAVFRSIPCAAQSAVSARLFAPIILMTDDGPSETISVDRFSNTLESVGISHELVGVGKSQRLNPLHYQLVIVALHENPSARSVKYLGTFLQAVLASGGNVLFIGPWICDLDPDLIAASFGVRSRSSQCLQNSGVGEALVLQPRRFVVALNAELMADLVSAGATTPVRVNRRALLTSYSAGPGHGRAVVITAPLLDYWKVDDLSQSFKRPLLLVALVQQLSQGGSLGKHPVLNAQEATLLLRLEDISPAAQSRFGWDEYGRLEFIRRLSKLHATPINVAIISRFINPSRGVDDGWSSPDPANRALRAFVRSLIEAGGTPIVHGYSHQLGWSAGDVTALDAEMSADDGSHFLGFDGQYQIIRDARDAFIEDWGLQPLFWETPHYLGDPSTYRAAAELGFRFITESDAWIFPNRSGLEGVLDKRILNIPETASSYPDEPAEIRQALRDQITHLLPDLAGLHAPYLFFFHLGSNVRLRALSGMLQASQPYRFWRPNLADFARFWIARERASLVYDWSPASQALRIVVRQGFPGLTLAIRLPDGVEASAMTINQQPVVVRPACQGAICFLRPVLSRLGDNTVQVQLRPARRLALGSSPK